jgi:hypothetical protein
VSAAFRQALTDRLRAKAKTDRWTLSQLQGQMAYDRLLERLYLLDEGWIMKGATAVLAGHRGAATIDIDIYRRGRYGRRRGDVRQLLCPRERRGIGLSLHLALRVVPESEVHHERGCAEQGDQCDHHQCEDLASFACSSD